jgi:hypothetical protein
MIQTFQQLYEEIQSGTQNSSASELILIKRDINVATQRFKSVMTRPWSRIAKKSNTVANQQDYQLPRSVLRVSGVEYLSGDTYYPLEEVGSEMNFSRLNAITGLTMGIPRFYFPKGKDIISLYPTPGSAVTEGLRVYYEPKQPRLQNADFTSGSVTVTQGNTTITHSGTGFTQSMVGSYFYTTDGSDGYEYQIVDYTSSSQLVLENYYEGPSGAGKSFVIGQVPDLPDEYIPATMDYAMGRFFFRRGDKKSGQEFMSMFLAALDECKEAYASPTSNPNIRNYYDNQYDIFNVQPSGLS